MSDNAEFMQQQHSDFKQKLKTQKQEQKVIISQRKNSSIIPVAAHLINLNEDPQLS